MVAGAGAHEATKSALRRCGAPISRLRPGLAADRGDPDHSVGAGVDLVDPLPVRTVIDGAVVAILRAEAHRAAENAADGAGDHVAAAKAAPAEDAAEDAADAGASAAHHVADDVADDIADARLLDRLIGPALPIIRATLAVIAVADGPAILVVGDAAARYRTPILIVDRKSVV